MEARSPSSSRIIPGLPLVDLPAHLEVLQQAVGDAGQVVFARAIRVRTHRVNKIPDQNYNK